MLTFKEFTGRYHVHRGCCSFTDVGEDGLAVVPFNPFAGGLLSGRYKHSDTPAKGRLLEELGQFGKLYRTRYWHQREFETVGQVQKIAEQKGTSMVTLSVAWVLANPAITSVILGVSQLDQLTDILAAADYNLDSAVKAQLDEVSMEGRRGDAGK